MDAGEDTETLLALISSLLNAPITDQSVLLDALVECNGNVEEAAQLLNAGSSSSKSISKDGVLIKQKRKRPSGLDDWLRTSPAKADPSASASGSNKPSKRHRSQSPFRTAGATREQFSTIKPLSLNASSSANDRASKPSSSSNMKAVTNQEFMSMLRPPNSAGNSTKPSLPKFPPLTLGTPELVAKHTPCTLHPSVLPPELACRLFYTMLDLSRTWDRNQWWLFDRMVESPHRTAFFVRHTPSTESDQGEMDEAAQFWYNGRKTGPSPTFPPVMEEACEYIEKIVNSEMNRRPRFPLEWGGDPEGSSDTHRKNGETKKTTWRANVAASNCYEGAQESVGFHTDRLSYLGPYPTIASLSLGTTRIFRLREVIPSDEKDKRSARTFNIPLPHNSLAIMHASCQETFKHCVPPQRTIDLFHPAFPPPPTVRESSLEIEDAELEDQQSTIKPSNARINVTFRFFRPDYLPSTTPKCKCGEPCVLRPDMKNRYTLQNNADGETAGNEDRVRKDIVAKYWWTCQAGAQNDGKGCGMWQVMDAKAEGRGPFVGDL